MRIELQLGGLAQVNAGLKSTASQLQALQSSTSRTRSSSQGSGLQVQQGAFQRLQRAREEFAAASQQGTANQIEDALENLRKAQQAVRSVVARQFKTPPLQDFILPTIPQPVKPKALNVRGPFARVSAAQKALQSALQSGIQDQVSDAQIALRKAQEALIRAQRPALRSSLGGRLASLLFSTRLNLPGIGGAGVSPLVGRLVTALGATGGTALALGGVAFGATLALGALKELANQAREGARSLGEAGGARSISGGTAGQVAGLQALGVAASDLAGIAASVRNARSSNPFAAATFGFQLPRPFGDVNEAAGLQEVINKLAGVDASGKRLSVSQDTLNTSTKRLAAARLVELDGLIPMIEAMRRNPQFLPGDTAARRMIEDATAAKNAGDLAYAQKRLENSTNLMREAFVKPLMPEWIRVTNYLATSARNLAEASDAHPFRTKLVAAIGASLFGLPGILYKLIEMKSNPDASPLQKAATGTLDNTWFLFGLTGIIYKMITSMQGNSSNPAGTGGSSSNPNLQASKDLAAVMKDLEKAILRGGVYGGADRARGAFPKHFAPSAMNANVNWNSLRLGFWSL